MKKCIILRTKKPSRLVRWILRYTLVLVLVTGSFVAGGPITSGVTAVELSYAEGGQSVEDPGSALPAGQRRYVDALNGNDNNDGQSPDTAWKTLTKVGTSYGSFSAGTHILFKRGQVWHNQKISFSNLNGVDGKRIVFGAYGLLNDNRPQFDGGTSLPGFLEFFECSYITVRDLNLEQISFKDYSHDCLVFNNYVHKMASNDINNGILLLGGVSHCAVVDNFIYDIPSNDCISIHDKDWVSPAIPVGDSHWIADNVIIGSDTQEDGIDYASAPRGDLPAAKDVKIINNRIRMKAFTDPGPSTLSGSGDIGIVVGHSGSYYWIVGNITGEADRTGIYVISGDAGSTNHDAQISGNITFNCGMNATNPDPSIRDHMSGAAIESNTVLHTNTYRESLGLYDPSTDSDIYRNLLISTQSNYWFVIQHDPRSYAVTGMDYNWFGNSTNPVVDGLTFTDWQSTNAV